MIPYRRGSSYNATPTADGWDVDAEHEWVVEASVAFVDDVQEALGRVAQRISPTVLLLAFRNAVGRYRAGPLGVLRVHSGKWTETHYQTMLSNIAAWSPALPFQAGAPSALPYSRTEVDAADVLYHVFVWLRHAVLEQPDGFLIGALRSIVRDPHRRMESRERVVQADRARSLSPSALDDVAAGLRPFVRVQMGRGLYRGNMFPAEVSERIAMPTSDTAENRFVKAFIQSCGVVVEAMRQRIAGVATPFANQVHSDCADIEGELAPIQRHRMWEDVGRMLLFPAASTVLQRRPAYREVLRHHILMRMASSALPLHESEVVQLLEVKDIARLYELWTAFAVIEAVREWKGPPQSASRIVDDKLSAKLGTGLVASWDDGTEVAYNATFKRASGFHGASWSLTLRPDVCLWVPRGPGAGLHVLDAKFKLSGLLAEMEHDSLASAKSADVHKMHTYRDAITQVRSAWVMYPGTDARSWHPLGSDQTIVDGVGMVPVTPGEEHEHLHRLVGRLLGKSASERVDAA